MVRHGERADNVRYEELGVEVEHMLDPPLTPLGFRQAEDTGRYLKEYFEKNGYTDIIIESSPFLRTLQTASTVANILGIKNIKINYILAKWMRVKASALDFQMSLTSSLNPFDNLLIGRVHSDSKDYKTKEEFVEHYLQGVNYTHELGSEPIGSSGEGVSSDFATHLSSHQDFNYVRQRFPEVIDDVTERVAEVEDQFMSQIQELNQQQGKLEEGEKPRKVAVLYFTHGTLLQQLSALNEENSK